MIISSAIIGSHITIIDLIVSPKIICWNPNPQYLKSDFIGDRVVIEVNKLK